MSETHVLMTTLEYNALTARIAELEREFDHVNSVRIKSRDTLAELTTALAEARGALEWYAGLPMLYTATGAGIYQGIDIGERARRALAGQTTKGG